MYPYTFNHLSTEEHLECFPILVMMNKLLQTFVCRFLHKHKFQLLWARSTKECSCWNLCRGGLVFFFFKKSHQTIFQSSCTILHFHEWWMKVPITSHSSPEFGIVSVPNFGQNGIFFLIWISLIRYDVEYLFICLLSICTSSFEKYLFSSLTRLLIGLFSYC